MAITFGNVPHPSFEDRLIPDSQNSAWNDLGQRRALGVCVHSMVGTLVGTDKWFRDGVPNPTHRAPALTDYGIGGSADGSLDGVIYRWNDPKGHRSGWANGGSDGLEGDGIAFVRALGVSAINRDLVSIERSDGGNINTPLSPKQFESLCQLIAYWSDQAKIPYTDFPLSPAVNLIMYLEHREFATKACPFDPVRGQVVAIQTRIRDILKLAQDVTAPEPIPEPPPKPAPTPPWPNGWTDADLDRIFGTLTEVDFTKDPITIKERGFSPKGMVSNAWVQRMAEEGITEYKRMPTPTDATIRASKDGYTLHMIVFPRSGRRDWILIKGDGNDAWRWLQ